MRHSAPPVRIMALASANEPRRARGELYRSFALLMAAVATLVAAQALVGWSIAVKCVRKIRAGCDCRSLRSAIDPIWRGLAPAGGTGRKCLAVGARTVWHCLALFGIAGYISALADKGH